MSENSIRDVVIICAAYELAKKGAQVTLIEQQEIEAGSSYGNGGLIVPSHRVPWAASDVPIISKLKRDAQ